MITAKKINKIVQTEAVHVLYHEDGKWYHHLKDFPGMLFDDNGFIDFKSHPDYLSNSYLQHGKDLNIPGDKSSIPGYKKINEEKELR